MNRVLPILIISFFVNVEFLYSQSLNGIYLCDYEKLTDTISVIYNLETGESVELDRPEIKTYYRQPFIILDFVNETDVYVKYLYHSPISGKYKLRNNELDVKSEYLTVNGMIYENNEIVLKEKTKDRVSEMHFRPIRKSLLKEDDTINFSHFADSYWKINSENSQDSIIYYYHIFDSVSSIQTTLASDYGRSDIVRVVFEAYKNHFFIAFIVHPLIEQRVYHIQYIDNRGIHVDYLEFKINSTPPVRQESVIIKSPLDNGRYDSLRMKLIGRWSTNKHIIPLGRKNKEDTLSNQKVVIEFKEDGNFNIVKDAILISNNKDLPFSDTISGKWILGKNLKYIDLHLKEGNNKTITFISFQNNTAFIGMNIRALTEPLTREACFEIKKITGLNTQ